ncbi:MAG: MFS transporter [Firmicutes bacterium]|nr:MFS transporter [Bacillota bacterium]
MGSRTKPAQLPLAAFWFAINFQQAALITIVIPTTLNRFHATGHITMLAKLVTIGDLVAMLAPALIGALSDRIRRRGGQRRPLILIGACADMVGLYVGGNAHNIDLLTAGFLLAVLGMTAAGAAFQAIMPELIRPSDWGRASGYMGVSSLLGNAAGLVIAGIFSMGVAYGAMIAVSGACALYTVAAVREPRTLVHHDTSSSGRRSLRPRAFYWVFAARILVLFGQTLLMTFVLDFFKYVLHDPTPAGSTASLAILSLFGAALAALLMGRISDRVKSRARIVAFASLPMALATALFGVTHSLDWIFALSVLYGMGYGAFLSVDWALALDTMPSLENVARNLGIWGMAATFPAVIAPAFGGLLLSHTAALSDGYKALFWIAGAAIFAGAGVVFLADEQGQRPSPLTIALCLSVALILRAAVQLRARPHMRGRLPFLRHSVLVVGNHISDLDSMIVPARLYLQGPWLWPPAFIGSQRLFEPLFIATRVPTALAPGLRWLHVAPILRRVGVLPIEEAPRTPPLISIAQAARERYGDLPVTELIATDIVHELQGLSDRRKRLSTLRDLEQTQLFPYTIRPFSWRLVREPYRSELRSDLLRGVSVQISAVQQALDAGRTVYLTPEGRLTPDGRLGAFHGILDAVCGRAERIYLCTVSYNPLRPGRQDLHQRLLPARPGNLWVQLAAARTITPAQLIAAAMAQLCDPFTQEQLATVAEHLLATLPPHAAVSADLQRNPAAAIRRAWRMLVRRGYVKQAASGAVRARPWLDRRYPHVSDLFDHLANQFTETAEALCSCQVSVRPHTTAALSANAATAQGADDTDAHVAPIG